MNRIGLVHLKRPTGQHLCFHDKHLLSPTCYFSRAGKQKPRATSGYAVPIGTLVRLFVQDVGRNELVTAP
jgi:hypothetical protein